MLYGALTREHAIPVAHVGRGNGIDIVDEFLANLWANESSIIVFRSEPSVPAKRHTCSSTGHASHALPQTRCMQDGICSELLNMMCSPVQHTAACCCNTGRFLPQPKPLALRAWPLPLQRLSTRACHRPPIWYRVCARLLPAAVPLLPYGFSPLSSFFYLFCFATLKLSDKPARATK